MAVVFTREEDLEAAAAHVPDRPISPHENLVTPNGLAQLETALSEARAAYAAARSTSDARTDKTAIAIAARDLRYFTARRASAVLVLPPVSSDIVAFGGRVTVNREDGRRQSFHIVGEDEADVKLGSISYIAPLAQALLGRGTRDVVTLGGSEVEIIAIE